MENGNLRYSHTFRGECLSFALFMKRTTFVPDNPTQADDLIALWSWQFQSGVCIVYAPNGRAILRARFEGIQRDGGNRVIMYIDKNKGTFFVFVSIFFLAT